MKPCCIDLKNRIADGNKNYTICNVCGCKHYEFIADPILIKGKF